MAYDRSQTRVKENPPEPGPPCPLCAADTTARIVDRRLSKGAHSPQAVEVTCPTHGAAVADLMGLSQYGAAVAAAAERLKLRDLTDEQLMAELDKAATPELEEELEWRTADGNAAASRTAGPG